MAFKGFIGKLKSFLFTGGKPVNDSAPPNIVDERKPDAADEWIFNGQWLMFRSSDVDEARYFHDEQLLEISFLSGNLCQYPNIPVEMAREFYHTASPGRWCWDNLRIPEREFVYITFSGRSPKKGPNVIRNLSATERRKLGI
jgi:hypothetical protein